MKHSVGPESALVRSFGALQSKTFDLCVVGGGAIGASVASRAAAAGLSVALLEAADFASGASGKSLAFRRGDKVGLSLGALRKIREVARERKRLHQIAPHLVVPGNVVVPHRYRMSRLRRQFTHSLARSFDQVGVATQDCAACIEPLQSGEPLLRAARFPHTWNFGDYQIDGARLVVSFLRDAVSNGAVCANYVRVDSIEQRRDLYFLYCLDTTATSEFAVRCRCVVDTTGLEADRLEKGDFLATVEADTAPALYSKRLQVAVPRDRLPIHYPMQLETENYSTVSVIPRGQVTYVIGATTFEQPSGVPEALITEDDLQYFLEPLAAYFLAEPIRAADVVSSSVDITVAAKTQSKDVRVTPRGTIACNETSFDECRSVRDEIMRCVNKKLQRAVIPNETCRVLPGGDLSKSNPSPAMHSGGFSIASEVVRLCTLYSMGEASALRLVRLYGCEVEQVIGPRPERLSGQVFTGEVDWAVSTEGAVTVEDVLYRRLLAVWYEPGDLALLLPAVTERMAELLAWDANEQTRQRIMAEQCIASDLAAVPFAG